MSLQTLLLLGLAIVAEVVGTTALKASDGLSRPWPALATIVGYGTAFYLMSVTMRAVPVGIVYAIWSGVGIVLISIAGFFVFGERPDGPAVLGIALILAGVVVLQAFSGSVRP